MEYQAYSRANFHKLPQLKKLTAQQLYDIEVVSRVLPFKANNFIVEHLIDWDAAPDDPIFKLTFPQRGMLLPEHYAQISSLLRENTDESVIQSAVEKIRLQLNPHPAKQMEHNIPYVNDEALPGMQHKYQQTVLFFPSQGQTCHAYCTFCFRWPQFIGMSTLRFASKEVELLIEYVRQHPEITDILFTGGDPMIMSARHLAEYIEPLLAAELPNLRRIRIGTKSLSYWPFRFLTDNDASEILELFKKVSDAGLHLAILAHFNHPRELSSSYVQEAIQRVRATGAE
ncbi:MAG: lysine 2,3-aminomutase, partial [Thioalkalispiraceae bacterium]